jgi:hypothetical protein
MYTKISFQKINSPILIRFVQLNKHEVVLKRNKILVTSQTRYGLIFDRIILQKLKLILYLELALSAALLYHVILSFLICFPVQTCAFSYKTINTLFFVDKIDALYHMMLSVTHSIHYYLVKIFQKFIFHLCGLQI